MNTRQRARGTSVWEIGAALLLACVLTACSPGEKASQMTSFSTQGSKSQTPELFTIPQDQMSHVQVVTVAPTKLARTLRLTGAVASTRSRRRR